jgi:hypothetical protein
MKDSALTCEVLLSFGELVSEVTVLNLARLLHSPNGRILNIA